MWLRQESKVAGGDQFTRLEDKFLLTSEQAHLLLSQLEARLPVSSPIPGTRFTRVESTYFDSDDLKLFSDHFSGSADRFKIRTRRYAPNGTYRDDAVHVEIKRKKQGISRKNRIQIGPQENHYLVKGEVLRATPAVLIRNQDRPTEKTLKHIERVNRGVEEYGLHPVMNVNYLRRAFEQGSFRVTLDEQIQWTPLAQLHADDIHLDTWSPERRAKAAQMLEAFKPERNLVLELKHSGQIPNWMTEFLNAHSLNPLSFSKYGYGILREVAPQCHF